MLPTATKINSKTTERPYVTTILAMSVDGKISDSYRNAARFPSFADQQHLERCLATADAALFGAGTLRAYGTTALIKTPELLATRRQKTQRPQPLQIVCSRSGGLDPMVRFFRQPIHRWLLTTHNGAKNWQGTGHFERVWVAPTDLDKQDFDWQQILTELKASGIHHLVVMGGGQLVAKLMSADFIDELWLTVCPVVIGGKNAPTPCDGHGFSLDNAPRFSLVSNQTVGDEVFLNYRRQR